MNIPFVPLDALRTCTPPPSPRLESTPWFHLVPGDKPLVLVVGGSQVYDVGPDLYRRLGDADPKALAELREAVPGAGDAPAAYDPTDLLPEPTALSLNLAQACNLSCAYCYADEGRFGGRPRLMSREVALAAVERLILDAGGRRVTVGFIGGEPLLNRPVLYESVAHARALGRRSATPVGFSITTNATLLTPADVALFREEGFTVTASLDGPVDWNDRYRTAVGGAGSSGARALAALRPLLDEPGAARLSARATIPRTDLRVAERVEGLTALGFREVGVSPLRTSADASLSLRTGDWPDFLNEMTHAARREWARVRRSGEGWRFSNLAIALKEIHRGSCRPLPCGAALGYLSVSAEGRYFTCHRTVDDPAFALGDLGTGPDSTARARFIAARQVDRQEPCRSCWARYLCGGGCHAEVIAAGREGCDYIRGWLDVCLSLYDDVLDERPDLLPPSDSEGHR